MHSVLHTTSTHTHSLSSPHTCTPLSPSLSISLYLSLSLPLYHTTTLHGTHHHNSTSRQLHNIITAPVDSTNRQSFYLCFPTTLTPLPTITSTSSLHSLLPPTPPTLLLSTTTSPHSTLHSQLLL